jgi:protein TonB
VASPRPLPARRKQPARAPANETTATGATVPPPKRPRAPKVGVAAATAEAKKPDAKRKRPPPLQPAPPPAIDGTGAGTATAPSLPSASAAALVPPARHAPGSGSDSAVRVALRWLDRGDRRNRLVVWTLGISIAIHALVLAIRFQPFDLKAMLDRGPPLEVALVNAKSKTKPTKAEILAQANLDGGGNTDQNRRAKSPLPVLPKDSANPDLSVATQKVEKLEQETKELMTRLGKASTAAVAQKPAEANEPKELPSANELMQRTLEAMRLEAQIAKDMDAYQKRPKRRFVGARAEEYRFARYVEDWRLKVERVGNLNYPEAARQLKLYGSLLLTVAIRADGSVETVEVNRSSGQRVLDAAAIHIVEMAAPYAAFPPDIRRDTDILHITRTWTFTKGDELRSE